MLDVTKLESSLLVTSQNQATVDLPCKIKRRFSKCILCKPCLDRWDGLYGHHAAIVGKSDPFKK